MEKIITKVGSVASVMSVLMYVSYIPQILYSSICRLFNDYYRFCGRCNTECKYTNR